MDLLRRALVLVVPRKNPRTLAGLSLAQHGLLGWVGIIVKSGLSLTGYLLLLHVLRLTDELLVLGRLEAGRGPIVRAVAMRVREVILLGIVRFRLALIMVDLLLELGVRLGLEGVLSEYQLPPRAAVSLLHVLKLVALKGT